MKHANWPDVLDVFLWGFTIVARPTLRQVLYGYDLDSDAQVDRLMRRLERKKLVKRSGRGGKAEFRITDIGMRQSPTLSPQPAWDKPWDSRWRAVVFDFPVVRRKDYLRLWKALRERKFGLLQGSIWIWPHDIESILLEITDAKGIPECFCGIESHRLFLCTDREVVAASWDFEEIEKHHSAYLKQAALFTAGMRSAKKLGQLAAFARGERQSYLHAFSRDPLLPQALWPKAYHGFRVEESHLQFRRLLRQRFSELAATPGK